MVERGLGAGFLAEFLATYLFVVFGVGSVLSITASAVGVMTPSHILSIALAHGLAIYVLVSVFGSVSGGHINPAVTLGLALSGKISGERAFVYILGQCAGAFFGAALVAWLVPNALQGGLGVHGLGTSVDAGKGFLIEVLFTTTLVLTVLMTAVKKNASSALAPLAIGMMVFLGIMVALPITGGSMNPARSMGPVIVSLLYGCAVPANQWVYLAGPVVGSILAAIIFGRFFRDV